MNFTLTAIYQGQCREFTIHTPTLERGLDGISRLAVLCDRLLHITLIDGDSHCSLPPLAFDGEPISCFIELLQLQWQAALQQPAPARPEFILSSWSAQQRRLLQTNVGFLESMLAKLDKERYWLQTGRMNESDQNSLLTLNERTCFHFQQCLAEAHRQLAKIE